jgi:hypothetical protein
MIERGPLEITVYRVSDGVVIELSIELRRLVITREHAARLAAMLLDAAGAELSTNSQTFPQPDSS